MNKIFISLILLIIVFPSAVYGQSDSNFDKEYGGILTHYYLKPVPDKIPMALEKFISSKFFMSDKPKQNNSYYTIAYSFGRIAQATPSLIYEYEKLFDKASHEGRIFILCVLKICGNEKVKAFLTDRLNDKSFVKEAEEISAALKSGMPLEVDIASKEAKNASDLDFLWSEFFVTGDERAILHIIDVLEWPDKTRKKLENYLISSTTASDKQDLVSTLFKEYGIKYNLSNNQIETKDDLDIIIASSLQQRRNKAEPFQEIKKALDLTNDDILYMVTKGSADWSLNSNAQQHKKVFAICDSEIQKRSDATKIGLLKICSEVYMSDSEIETATERLKQLISLDPTNARAHFSLGSEYVKEKNVNEALREEDVLRSLNPELASKLSDDIEYLILAELSTQKNAEVEGEVADSKTVGKILLQNELIKKYRTKFTFIDFTQEAKQKGHLTVEWDAEYVAPDRFYVTQSAWEKEGPVYDRWITIGKEHYFQIGGWFKEPDKMDSDWRNNTNKLLGIDKWIYIMKNNDLSSIKIYQSDNKKFIVLRYSPINLINFLTTGFGDNVAYDTEIWVDASSLFIVKTALSAKGKSTKDNKIDIIYVQVYRGYNSNIEIEKPKDFFDLNKQSLDKVR